VSAATNSAPLVSAIGTVIADVVAGIVLVVVLGGLVVVVVLEVGTSVVALARDETCNPDGPYAVVLRRTAYAPIVTPTNAIGPNVAMTTRRRFSSIVAALSGVSIRGRIVRRRRTEASHLTRGRTRHPGLLGRSVPHGRCGAPSVLATAAALASAAGRVTRPLGLRSANAVPIERE